MDSVVLFENGFGTVEQKLEVSLNSEAPDVKSAVNIFHYHIDNPNSPNVMLAEDLSCSVDDKLVITLTPENYTLTTLDNNRVFNADTPMEIDALDDETKKEIGKSIKALNISCNDDSGKAVFTTLTQNQIQRITNLSLGTLLGNFPSEPILRLFYEDSSHTIEPLNRNAAGGIAEYLPEDTSWKSPLETPQSNHAINSKELR